MDIFVHILNVWGTIQVERPHHLFFSFSHAHDVQEDKKHPEVGVLALEYATSVAFSHQFRGVKSNSSVYVPQGTRPKRDKWNADEVTGGPFSGISL